MLIMVIENPMQFTIVNDVPRYSGLALFATRVENKGESATTTIPQNNKKMMSTLTGTTNKSQGEIRQHIQERNKQIVASFFTPTSFDIHPLIKQASPPDAMMKNESNGILKFSPGKFCW